MVGIIPKPMKKITEWYNLVFYISLALLIVLILTYVILIFLSSKTFNNLQNLEDQILAVGTWEEKILESQVLNDNEKINDFSKLIEKHRKSSNFFQLLETITHPKIWFTELDLNTDNNEAVISGKTSNFQVLGQQALIFQKQDFIQSINLSNLSIGEGGEVEFSFRFSLDPQIFQ